MSDGSLDVEKFYVYRSLHHDESWGAIIMTSTNGMPHGLPNIDFGMRVFARNEKEAITKAKLTYDKIHSFDSDKENIRRFAAAALKQCILKYETREMAAREAMQIAVQTNNEFNKYFAELTKEETNNE